MRIFGALLKNRRMGKGTVSDILYGRSWRCQGEFWGEEDVEVKDYTVMHSPSVFRNAQLVSHFQATYCIPLS